MLKNRIFICIILSTIYIQLSFGREHENDIYARFVNYKTPDGLSNNTVNDIIQDSRGFMWFATENGLNRFDGYEFIQYYHDPLDSLSIPGNTITSLSVDNNDNLWIGTTGGLCRLSLDNGSIKRYTAKPGNINSPRTNHIRKLLFSELNNLLWIETLEGTLTSYDPVTGEWEHFSHTAVSQPYYRYHALFEDTLGNIWLGGRNTPVMKLDINSKSITSIKAEGFEKKGKRDNDTGDIYETTKGQWFITGLDGIYRFYPEDNSFSRIFHVSAYSITEDRNGIVWFATGNGLLSYNPTLNEFTSYRYDQNNPLSLAGNHTKTVFTDKDDNLWVGTTNGVSLLSKKSSVFGYYYNIPGVSHSLSSNNVTTIEQDNAGTLYIGTDDEGVNVWQDKINRFDHLKINQDDPCAISSNRVSTLYLDSGNKLWVGLWAGTGFDVYDPAEKCFTGYTYDNTSLKRDWYNAFLEDEDGNMLVGMWGANGSTYFDKHKGEFTEKHYITFEKPFNRPVNKLINDNNHNFFFISGHSPVIFMYDALPDEYSSHDYNPGFPKGTERIPGRFNSLPFDFDELITMDTDEEGFSIFITNMGIIGYQREKGFHTVYQGNLYPLSATVNKQNIFILENDVIKIIDRDTQKLTTFKVSKNTFKKINSVDQNSFIITGIDSLALISIGDSNDIYDKHVLQFQKPVGNISSARVNNNSIWIGSQDGLYYIDIAKITGELDEYTAPKKIIDLPVSMITFDKYNSRILAFTPLGVYSIDITDHDRRDIIELHNEPRDFNTAVNTASMVNEDTAWVGNSNGHYWILPGSGRVIDKNIVSEKRVSSHLTTCLLQDSDGNKWIGTSDKGLNRVDKKTKRITHFYKGDKENTLPGNNIAGLLQSSDGKIWIATEGGLSYFYDGVINRIGGVLQGKKIFSVIESADESIWVATNEGLACINKNGKVEMFDEADGIPSTEFTYTALKLQNNNLAFGTTKGFFVFNPAKLKTEPSFYNPPHINKFSIFDDPANYHFKKHDTIILHHTENFFQVNFSASSYGLKPGTKYRYKLEGVDPDWVETTSNKISYTNIAPGRYHFRVTSMLSSGLPGEQYASLQINIPPPFYKTAWFRATIFLLIIAALSSYLIIYIQKYKTYRANIELTQRLLSSQMNPHFIFNSLTAIQSFMYSNKPAEAGNYLSSFSHLVRLILDNSRSDYISVKQEIKTLELYLEIQKLRFSDKLNYEINIPTEVIESDILIPPMLAQPFIENSIEHGILHKKDNGHINISMEIENKTICVIIEDDGIGIDNSKQLNLEKRLSHISYATSITKDRIKNLSKRNNKKFGIRIVDLKSVGKQGTRVELIFPCKRKKST